MSTREEHDGIKATGGYSNFTGPPRMPCQVLPWRWRLADHRAHLAAWPLLVVLLSLTAVPIQAQTAPATHGPGDDRTLAKGVVETGTDIAEIVAKPRPKITITADRDTIYGNLEDLRMVLKREQAGDSLTVKIWLQQDENWLTQRVQTRYVFFYPQDTVAVLKVHRSQFDPDVTESGCIVAKVTEARGYNIRNAKAPVWVISSPAPFVTLLITRGPESFGEDEGSARAHLVARMTLGMPRGVEVRAAIETRGKDERPATLTATSGRDFEAIDETVLVSEDDYEIVNGWWVARTDLTLSLFDDDLREGDEVFEVTLTAPDGQSEKVEYLNGDGTTCWGRCKHRVQIIDDEEMPAMDLSVSADEIMEEGETSSDAVVSITDGVRFEDEQVLTFGLGGTATRGADYAVSPADADDGMPGYQVVLPAQAASVGLSLEAMSDEVDDPNERIEVSAALDGDAIGDMQAVQIMNQELPLPKISVAANRDTIIGSMENLVLTLTREESLDERLRVTVQVAQDQHWLPWTSCPATFEAGAATASVTIPHGTFSSDIVQSGHLTLTVSAVDGYDTDNATVTVYVVSQDGPAVKVFFDQDTYRFAEDRDDATALLIVEAAPGMPRGTTVAFSMYSESGTAIADEDFEGVSRQMTIREEDFSFQNGSWQVRRRMPVTLFDDEVREGDETCDLVLENAQEAQADLGLKAVTPVDITDDEDIPEMDLRLSADEIKEEGETSSVATVSITNGKMFATDQTITFTLGGSATHGADYRVSPADADQSASGHQVVLPAGSESVKATFTAQDDDVQDPDEEIRVSVGHDGHAIGNRSIGIREELPGPTVRVTFEGVQPTNDSGVDGIATGPFQSRLVFSERVEGFTQEDLHWSTRAWTTEDSTSIGIHVWDFKEVRAGLEYTAEMMPTQKGEVSIGVKSDKATSVATGAGNEWGGSSLRVEFPGDRMLVAPTEVTVREGDAGGAFFAIVLTSEPSSDVTVEVSGMEGTAVEVDRSTITIPKEFWRSGRAVDVSAGHDANTANETVTLNVSPSGGGYDGRDANVVVTVVDDDAGFSTQGMLADDALTLVDDVTPEEAAAALFGEGDLSEAQLEALDRLGNSNGDYDLGDLLSWVERCQRGEAACGAAAAGSDGPVAALPGGSTGGQGGGASQRNRGNRTSAPRRQKRALRFRRRPGRSWYGLALMLLASVTWACADDGVQPGVAEPDPGFLTVRLTAPPMARDLGVLLVVEGPGIESVRSPGFEMFQSESTSPLQIVVAGGLSTGPIVQLQVPDRGLHALYRVRLLQVTGEDHSLRDLSEYEVVIGR